MRRKKGNIEVVEKEAGREGQSENFTILLKTKFLLRFYFLFKYTTELEN